MQIPHFPEANHPLVKSLFHHSDQELLNLFQTYPDEGKYFTVIFCRYSPIVYTLIQHSARSPVQADYLFALTWKHIYYELGGLNLGDSSSTPQALTLQNWLINLAAFCINEIKLPPTEAIHYSLSTTSPPLWCYVEQALDQLPPMLRLIVLMSQTFHWSETRIAAYLQAEGEKISPLEVANFLQEGYSILEDKLPADIRAIYLDEDFVQS
ncbi:sigma-70 family RNA polymerase sigma factor [Nodularia harveyana UHCC-0300]|uniref:Sigma-70 family RNA polymerase sigma factor n=1 Tax=Nodularia harveyana UHCC-0300 TaxID=2974287 RepID=A0ABU5UG72_9CYAN|nr:sigma-70 family RNA polymerase sigma factor [Nodularia harveyana]MEA5582318.1 sigma-70 family RNA polymerase sigma factor [Nodularia harveyana UHCC-0300]